MSCRFLAGVKLAAAEAFALLMSSGCAMGEESGEGHTDSALQSPAVVGITVTCIAVFAVGGLFYGCCPKRFGKSGTSRVADDKRSLLGSGQADVSTYSSTEGVSDLTPNPRGTTEAEMGSRTDSTASLGEPSHVQLDDGGTAAGARTGTSPSKKPAATESAQMPVKVTENPAGVGAGSLSGYANALQTLESSEAHEQSPSPKRAPTDRSAFPLAANNAAPATVGSGNASQDRSHAKVEQQMSFSDLAAQSAAAAAAPVTPAAKRPAPTTEALRSSPRISCASESTASSEVYNTSDPVPASPCSAKMQQQQQRVPQSPNYESNQAGYTSCPAPVSPGSEVMQQPVPQSPNNASIQAAMPVEAPTPVAIEPAPKRTMEAAVEAETAAAPEPESTPAPELKTVAAQVTEPEMIAVPETESAPAPGPEPMAVDEPMVATEEKTRVAADAELEPAAAVDEPEPVAAVDEPMAVEDKVSEDVMAATDVVPAPAIVEEPTALNVSKEATPIEAAAPTEVAAPPSDESAVDSKAPKAERKESELVKESAPEAAETDAAPHAATSPEPEKPVPAEPAEKSADASATAASEKDAEGATSSSKEKTSGVSSRIKNLQSQISVPMPGATPPGSTEKPKKSVGKLSPGLKGMAIPMPGMGMPGMGKPPKKAVSDTAGDADDSSTASRPAVKDLAKNLKGIPGLGGPMPGFGAMPPGGLAALKKKKAMAEAGGEQADGGLHRAQSLIMRSDNTAEGQEGMHRSASMSLVHLTRSRSMGAKGRRPPTRDLLRRSMRERAVEESSDDESEA